MEEGWVVLSQAPYQSIRKEEWKEMREKLKEYSKKIVVKQAGKEVVGLAKLAWRTSLKEDFFSAEEEQIHAYDRESALRESLLGNLQV